MFLQMCKGPVCTSSSLYSANDLTVIDTIERYERPFHIDGENRKTSEHPVIGTFFYLPFFSHKK